MSENKVKWHPYPEEKPKNDSLNPYLVTWLYDGVCGKEPEVDLFYYEDDAFKWNLENEVIAWAELPEPYKEQKNDQSRAN